MCLSFDHSTESCEYVGELVPFTYDSARQGKDIFKSKKEYFSDTDDSSQDSLFVGGSKGGEETEVKSSINEEEVQVSEALGQAKGKLVADEGENEGTNSRVMVFGLPAEPEKYFQRYYIRRERKEANGTGT